MKDEELEERIEKIERRRKGEERMENERSIFEREMEKKGGMKIKKINEF